MDGQSIFRKALLLESAINVASLVPILLAPETALSYMVRGPSQITPATKSLTQLLSGVVVLATAPLVLSYSEEGQSVESVTAKRRLTYAIMGISELAIGGVTLAQYVMGDSGLTDQALLIATATLTAFGGMRGYFLYVKPEWMKPSPKESGGKKLK